MRGKWIGVAVVFVLLVLGALTLCGFFDVSLANPKSRSLDCRHGLKQMGVYFSLYVGKFGAYPDFGTGTNSWFAQIWRPEFSTDGNLFRCASVGKAGRGTHYWCIVKPGTWKGFSFAKGADLGPSTPGDLPLACDQLVSPPNHGPDPVNVLLFDGRVISFEVDSDFVRHPPDFLGPSGWDAPAGTK